MTTKKPVKKVKKNKYLVYEPFTYLAPEILKYLRPFRKLHKYALPAKSLKDPITMRDWNKILDKMIWAFDIIDKSENTKIFNRRYFNIRVSKEGQKKVMEGLHLFAEYFQGLWD